MSTERSSVVERSVVEIRSLTKTFPGGKVDAR
jgi:hypothetical protein